MSGVEGDDPSMPSSAHHLWAARRKASFLEIQQVHSWSERPPLRKGWRLSFLPKKGEACAVVIRSALFLIILSLLSCAPVAHQVADEERSPPSSSFLSTSDRKRLSLEHWNEQREPKQIIIALHGIGGAATDFKNLGKALPTQAPATTLYALNLRANGYDPEPGARGDISDPTLWVHDLQELHRALIDRHPEAQVIWLGESMGSLIVLHAAAQREAIPAGIILSSPVIAIEAIPRSQRILLRMAARLLPRYRLSLAALAGGDIQATTHSQHFAQSQKNEYNIERYTLRFLSALANLAEEMPAKARETHSRALILHGSKDFLSSQREIEAFSENFSDPPELREFSLSHHLIFFDKQRNEAISSLLQWCESLPD